MEYRCRFREVCRVRNIIVDEYCVFVLFKFWNSLEKSAFVTVGHFVDVHIMHCNDISYQ